MVAPLLINWIPEDDLKLKNAVQAGASLEALAKGAVRFSRRYTIHEIKNRWHSLLYDPDTSALASAHMVELELSSASNSNNSLSDIKGNGNPKKRKDESVRRHYYEERKRLRSLFHIESPLHNGNGLEGGCEESVRINNENTMGACMVEDTVVDHLNNDYDTNFDMVSYGVPQVSTGDVPAGTDDTAAHVFHSNDHDSLVGEIPGGNCFFDFPEDVSYILDDEAIGSDIAHCFDDDAINALDEKLDFLDPLGVQETGPPEVLPFESANLTTTSCEFDPVNNNPVITHSGFGHSAGELVGHVDDATQVSSSGYNVVHSDCHLEDILFDDGLTNSRAVSEGDFLDLSFSPLIFTNEMNDDGKEMTDCFDLSSLFHSSPNDVHQDDMSSFTEPRASAAMDSCSTIDDIACPEELNAVGGTLQSGNMTCDSDNSVPSSTLTLDPHPEYRDGVICCTLNTEDPDIPCNDDVYFPNLLPCPLVSAEVQHNTDEDGSSFPLSTTDFSVSGMTSEHGLNPAEKEEEALATSGVAGPQILAEISSIDPICDAASRRIGIVGGEQTQCGSAQFTPYSISPGELKEDAANVEQWKLSDSLLERSVHSLENNENHPWNIINDYKQEPGLPCATEYYVAEDYGSDLLMSEPAVNPQLLNQEEQPFEDDNDVPHFPDIETVILGMDLGSFDQDSCIGMNVSRYQHEQAKRKILKLEHSGHTQRAIASHSAFAIFYGRFLKYYIKKPKVTLGRVTDDVSVDIDLAKEGHANKISRRQDVAENAVNLDLLWIPVWDLLNGDFRVS
ncbi:Forkhead-associated (FHA) domain [Thalictrum thalictroides]|uniref:Forkhead-associated (FHA) domain n=1 Tax=Thalictrum thalictroides TaxID=46969 RepID=A0A7J6W6G6_THATH|nr:Forkhead-associated (FHA) domain [Thalictrum thalictroides]